MLAQETGAPEGSAEPFAAAVALVGVIRAAFEASHDSRGRGGNAVAALNLLAGGLASYAVRTEPHIDNPEQP